MISESRSMGCPSGLVTGAGRRDQSISCQKEIALAIFTALAREKLMRAAPQGTGVKRRGI